MPPVLSSHPNAKIRKRSAAGMLGFVSALPLLWTRGTVVTASGRRFPNSTTGCSPMSG